MIVTIFASPLVRKVAIVAFTAALEFAVVQLRKPKS